MLEAFVAGAGALFTAGTLISMVLGVIAGIIAAAIPGPGVIALVARALGSGFRPTLPMLFGLALGDVVYLAAAYVLKHREMVTIELILRNPRSLWRKLAESLAILIMFLFAGAAIYFGFSLWLHDTLAGHTTDTYLAPPKWFTHAPVWVGNALLVLQGAAQLVRVWTEELPEDDILEGAH